MSFEKARDLLRHFLTMNRRTFETGVLGDIGCTSNGHTAQSLDSFGNGVGQFALFARMLIEQEMELIESGT